MIPPAPTPAATFDPPVASCAVQGGVAAGQGPSIVSWGGCGGTGRRRALATLGTKVHEGSSPSTRTLAPLTRRAQVKILPLRCQRSVWFHATPDGPPGLRAARCVWRAEAGPAPPARYPEGACVARTTPAPPRQESRAPGGNTRASRRRGFPRIGSRRDDPNLTDTRPDIRSASGIVRCREGVAADRYPSVARMGRVWRNW